MRTIKVLLDLLNPDRRKSYWTYIPVVHREFYKIGVNGAEQMAEHTKLYEVYFDEKGNFIGAQAIARAPYGDDVNELKASLELMIRGCSNPTITYEELKLIRQDN